MKGTLLSCLMLLFPVVLIGQNAIDYKLFMDAAHEHSALFRGALPLRFGHRTSHDGSTFYAYSPHYEPGSLVFCGKHYTDVRVNLNAAVDELYVIDPVKNFPVSVNKYYVASFLMGAHLFVYYKPDAGSLLKEGYYELLYSGNTLLFKKIQKIFREETNQGDKIFRTYLLTESFYVQKNNIWYRIGNKADVKRLFPQQKKTIDRITKTKELDFINNKGMAFIEILAYMDSL